MSMLTLDRKIHDVCNQAIVISGGARSGTTILGKILHSMQRVEYVFEPPMLFSLLPLVNSLPAQQWKLLYETYLYEEFLMNALAGRNINCNQEDDSSILRVKDAAEIAARQAKSWRKNDLEKIAEGKSTIVYKVPDMMQYLPPLQKLFPGTRVVVALRNINDTLHSLRRKGWFSDKNLRDSNQLWPNNLYKGFKLPYFVAAKDYSRFVKYDELHRLAYYILTTHSQLKKIKNAYFLHYEALVDNPKGEIKKLANHLGLQYGPKTQAIIDDVQLRPEDRSEDFVAGLEPALRKQIRKLEQETQLL